MFQFHILWLLLASLFLPTVAAMPNLKESAFPDLTFKVFSEFIFSHFSSQVSLATVLVLLFTMTENPELLSLHARQQNPKYSEENHVQVSGWMKVLSKALTNRLEEETQTLFKKAEGTLNQDQIVFSLGIVLLSCWACFPITKRVNSREN